MATTDLAYTVTDQEKVGQFSSILRQLGYASQQAQTEAAELTRMVSEDAAKIAEGGRPFYASYTAQQAQKYTDEAAKLAALTDIAVNLFGHDSEHFIAAYKGDDMAWWTYRQDVLGTD